MAAPRSNSRLALIAALLLGAACKRAPVEAPAETPELSAPEPSSTLVSIPLDSATTGYTNEMQALNLSKETSELGIQQISKNIEEGSKGDETRGAPPPLSEIERKERMAQLKEMRIEFTRQRRSMDSARDKSVVLGGNTAAIIKGM